MKWLASRRCHACDEEHPDRHSGQRHLGRDRRPGSGAAPHGPPDVAALAREAVISFLQDASKATAEREAVRAGAAATDAEATVTAAAGNTAGDGASMADGILAAAPEPEAMPRGAISAASPVAAESEAWRLAAIAPPRWTGLRQRRPRWRQISLSLTGRMLNCRPGPELRPRPRYVPLSRPWRRQARPWRPSGR